MHAQTASKVSPKEVVAYNEDVWTWVYFDQIDQVLRYEAYIIDYQESGEPGSLRLVLEEGLITDLESFNLQSSVIARYLLKEQTEQPEGKKLSKQRQFPIWPHIEIDKTSLYFAQASNFYRCLTPKEISLLHEEFHRIEKELKQRNKKRWKKRLRLLGFDVMDSAY